MSDVDPLANIFTPSNVSAGIGFTWETVLIIILLAVIGLIIFFVLRILSYNIRVVIRDVVKGRHIITYDKAKRHKDKIGNYWWILLKEKAKIPEPPAECIETTNKGKKFIELFKLKDSGYFPAKRTDGYVAIRSTIGEKDFSDRYVEGFEPLTTQDRALMAHEFREAEKYKRANKSELIAKAIPYVALILILTVLLLFAGEFFNPLFENQQRMEQLQAETWQKISITIDKLDKIIDDEQVIGNNITNSSGVPI